MGSGDRGFEQCRFCLARRVQLRNIDQPLRKLRPSHRCQESSKTGKQIAYIGIVSSYFISVTSDVRFCLPHAKEECVRKAITVTRKLRDWGSGSAQVVGKPDPADARNENHLNQASERRSKHTKCDQSQSRPLAVSSTHQSAPGPHIRFGQIPAPDQLLNAPGVQKSAQ